ncbi:MAG: aminotransferase class V-fold PLP-dependent enzyme [Bacteroidota bacterium]
MISFYPGPSRVYDEIPNYVKDAYKKGILSINHRSDDFMRISERTIRLLKEKLDIPKTYTIFYTTSATECWEMIAQSLITGKSYHLYNGAFGQKWFDYTKRLQSGAIGLPFDREKKIETVGDTTFEAGSVICITQNETSNGTQVDNRTIKKIKKNNPQCLVAVDATSSMAGVSLNFAAADIWFASVQKCFGLPAGLGVMVCSPAAMNKIESVGEKAHYNSLAFVAEMMQRWQTPMTPNVLGIYLLMRVMEKVKPIAEIHKKTVARYNQWIDFFHGSKPLSHLITNEAVHSHTVIPVKADPELMISLKAKAVKKGLLLGEGYGDLKSSTFRIANFPALKKIEIEKLQQVLKTFL